MIEWIKVILILTGMSFVSFLLGNAGLKKLNLKTHFYFAVPLGFYFFLALFQILVYPIQYFHFPAWTLEAVLLVLILGICIFCRKEIKELKHVHWKSFLVVLLLLIACTGIYIFSSNLELVCDNQSWALLSGRDDIFYYTRLISVNADPLANVNALEPINGLNGIVPNLYAFTGILHMFSGLCMLFDLNAWMLIVWFNFVFLRFIAFLNVFNMAKLLKAEKKIKLILMIAFIGALFVGRGFQNGFEPVYFRGYTGIGFVLIYTLLLYFQTQNIQWIKLNMILTTAMLSCQSTQMFLGAILLSCCAVYDAVINHKFDIKILSILAAPIVIYITFFISYERSIVLGLVLAGIFVLVNLIYHWKKELFKWQIVPAIGIAALIVMVGYGFMSQNPSFALSETNAVFGKYLSLDVLSNAEAISGSFDFLNDFLQKGMLIVSIYFLMNWKKISFEVKFCCIFFLTSVILFYNPLVMPFVSTYMTGIVYSRIENVVLSSVFYFTFLSYFDQKYPYLGKACLISSLSVILVLGRECLQYWNHFPLYSEHASLKYKMDKSIPDMSDFIDEYFNNEKITVLYPISLLNLRLYNENFISSSLQPDWAEANIDAYLYRYNSLSSNMKLQCMMELPIDYFTNYFYEFEPDWVPDLKKILLESDADIVIMKKWEDKEGEDRVYHELLEQFTEIIYDNGIYQIYQIYR